MTLICSELGLQEISRDTLAILKIKIGKREDNDRATYTILLHHGTGTDSSSLKKDEQFINSFENADIICTGHTHRGKCGQFTKHVIDPHNNHMFDKTVSIIIANSYLRDADYALKSMLTGTPHSLISFDLPKNKNKRVSIHID